MPPKIDFHLQLDKLLNASDIKVGQDATLQQEEGSWTCSLGSQLLGTVPASLIPDLQSHDSCKATIRSLKRSIEDPDQVSSVQVRISISPAEQPQPLVRAEPPAEDPAGFSLTTTELERLAYNEDFRTTLKDTRLQQLLLKIDGSANREQALKEALGTQHFRDFADSMLSVMKPGEYSSQRADFQ